MVEKCLNCQVYKEMTESNVPCACAWYIDNIVCGDKTIDECPIYKDIKTK